MDLNELMSQIIPPQTKERIYGYSNTDIIDGLSEIERQAVENALIQSVTTAGHIDQLAVKTLAYMRSVKAVPALYRLLAIKDNHVSVLITAVAIYQIVSDPAMIDTGIDAFRKMNDDTLLILPSFAYLAMFRSEKADDVIRAYINDKEPLVAYNAQKALERSLA